MSANFQTLFDLADWINGVFLITWKPHRTSQYTILTELRNGCLLIKLTSALLSMKLPTLYQQPSSTAERIANIELCLETLKDNGTSLSGFLAKDIAEGGLEVVLAFGHALKREFSFRFWYPRRELLIPQDTVEEEKNAYRPNVLEEIQELQESIRESKLETSCPLKTTALNSTILHQCTAEQFLHPQMHDIKSTPKRFHNAVSNLEKPVCHSTPYEKVDVDLLFWLSSLLGTKITTFERLMDGRLICQLVNILHPGSIPPQVVQRSSTSDRFYLAFRIATHEFGLPRDWEIGGLQDLRTQDALRQFLRELYYLSMKREPRSIWRRRENVHTFTANLKHTDSAPDISFTVNDRITSNNRTLSWPEEISAMIPDLRYQSSDLSLSYQELDTIERRGKMNRVELKVKEIQEKINKFKAARQKFPKNEKLAQTLLPVQRPTSRAESMGLETSRTLCLTSGEFKGTTSNPAQPELNKSLSSKLSDVASSAGTTLTDSSEVTDSSGEHTKIEKKETAKETSQHYRAAQAITALARMSSRRPQGAFTI